jgi:[ribosomal protein S5]-alanine N-acetyltransferase
VPDLLYLNVAHFIEMEIKTEHLTIRDLTFEDASFIVQLLNTPGWLRFIGDRGVKTISDAEQYLSKGPMESYAKNGFGLWLVLETGSDIPAGLCGLLKRDYLDHPDIGFAFLPEFTGKGYATEAIKATLRLARLNLHIETLLAITTPDNERSQRALMSTNFSFVRTIVNEKNEELHLYKCKLEE